LREAMRETAADPPALRDGNVCISWIFADARRGTPRDSLKRWICDPAPVLFESPTVS
jgi:hypothetical protein